MTSGQDLGTTLICQRQVVFFQQSPGQLLQNYCCKQNCAFSDVPEQPWSVNGKLSSSNNLQWRFSMPTIPSNSLENKYNIKADMRNVKWFTQIYLPWFTWEKHISRKSRQSCCFHLSKIIERLSMGMKHWQSYEMLLFDLQNALYVSKNPELWHSNIFYPQ